VMLTQHLRRVECSLQNCVSSFQQVSDLSHRQWAVSYKYKTTNPRGANQAT
jgi:hypothetical protein